MRRHREANGLSEDDLVLGCGKLDPDGMRPCRKPRHDDRAAIANVGPMPGKTVHADVKMAGVPRIDDLNLFDLSGVGK